MANYVTELHRHQNRHRDQWNRTESPETNPHAYGQLVHNKGAKNIQRGWTVSSINGAGKTGRPRAKE